VSCQAMLSPRHGKAAGGRTSLGGRTQFSQSGPPRQALSPQQGELAIPELQHLVRQDDDIAIAAVCLDHPAEDAASLKTGLVVSPPGKQRRQCGGLRPAQPWRPFITAYQSSL